LLNNNLPKNQYVSGQNFVLLSNVVFAANISNNLPGLMPEGNIKVINENNLYKTYKIVNINLKDGDVVFCSTGYVELLFYYLKKLKKVNNITLITGQSDRPVEQNLFKQKPKCIVSWYSVNVDHKNELLKPIPLGLANDYSPKNIRIENFLNYKNDNETKESKLYVNLQKNTNLRERAALEETFKGLDWVVYKEPNLNIGEYMSDLHKYEFVLCPWGNGFDTHRLWEALYSGAIPVTKKHKTYKSFKKLPIIFVDDLNDFTLESLMIKKNLLEESNLDMLNMSYWKKEIFTTTKENYSKETILENKIYELYFWKKLEVLSFFRNKLKIVKYYFHKALKRI
tara:strand:- start:2323 stop:3342 length:1020 start_codon:yes stop_codon:yes gene_type:complete